MRNEIQVAGQQTGIKLRPYEHHAKYYETDQMGIIHHSNYVKWMEEARMDLMDQMGLSYKQMEEMEIISPVLSIAVEYHSMVHFDDTVVIQTKLVKYNGIKMEVEYVMTDKETGELRTTARSSHCFLNRSGKPISQCNAEGLRQPEPAVSELPPGSVPEQRWKRCGGGRCNRGQLHTAGLAGWCLCGISDRFEQQRTDQAGFHSDQ